eukprot:g6313.t1
MPLRAVAGLIVACIAAETSAFVHFSTRAAGVIAGNGSTQRRPPSFVILMGKRGGSKKKRSGVVYDEGETGRIKGAEGASEEEEEEDEAVPRLVVMDLDYTLWKPELYQMRGAPFTKKDGKVRDRGGEVIDLFPGVREALLEVHRGHRFQNTKLAIASRTSHDRWAREVMGLLELEPGLPMHSVFSYSEIYSGSKVRHFGEIRRNSRIPYKDMIFFDDWDQNCKDVGKLGVTCIECRRGLNQEVANPWLKPDFCARMVEFMQGHCMEKKLGEWLAVPVQLAAARGDKELTEELVRAGAGGGPIYAAIRAGQHDLVKNLRQEKKQRHLRVAVEIGNEAMVSTLPELGADSDPEEHWVYGGSIDALDEVGADLEAEGGEAGADFEAEGGGAGADFEGEGGGAGADLEAEGGLGIGAALHAAVESPDSEATLLPLLRHGAKVEPARNGSTTPLSVAVKAGSVRAAKVLVLTA